MADKIQQLQIRRFNGGISSFEKIGPEYSGADITLDIFTDPSYMTMPKASGKVSGSTVADLVIWAVDGSPFDTNRYFYDLAGKIYKETSGGTWSLLRTVSGGAGEGLEIFDDYIYYMQATNIGRYGRLSGTPAFNDDLTSWWAAAISDIQDTGGGTGNTYSTATSIDEGATHRQTFTANHDPLKSIVININDTGDDPDWTVTVHDADNNLIGSKTTAFASVTTGDNTFTFTTPLRLVIGNEYHFHVTTSTTTGAPKVTTTTSSDLEGASYTINYGVLIDCEFHPTVVVEDKLIIGNEQYLAVFDQATYEPNKILLDRGFQARTITKIDEYIVVGAYKGATVTESEESRLFYWDTIQTSWNYFTDTTTIGAPNALTNTGNKLRGVYGNRGGLYQGDKPFQALRNKLATLEKGKTLNIYPSALAGIENITLLGIAGETTATDLRIGVYAFGAQEESLPDSFVFLHRMSTGNITDSGLKIGFVKVFGSTIYFSWKDAAGNYGVDTVPITATALNGDASFASLLFDGGDSKKNMLVTKVTASFSPLQSGETVKVGYQPGSSFDSVPITYGDTVSTVGATEASVSIYSRLKEVLAAVVASSSNGTFLRITELAIHYNLLDDERSS